MSTPCLVDDACVEGLHVERTCDAYYNRGGTSWQKIFGMTRPLQAFSTGTFLGDNFT